MYREPEAWHALLDRLADGFARVRARAGAAGADVIQLFDSWVGVLSPADYEEFVAPYSARILDAVDVPTIHFGTGTRDAAARDGRGGDVIGLDWRIPLDEGWERSATRGVQGNLDPAVAARRRGSGSRRRRATCSSRAAGAPGHIFNLGHGVLPQTDPDVLDAADRARARRARWRRACERGGRPDGVRVTRAARGRARVLRRHPRRPADRARAPRRPRRALPPARRRGAQPAERDHRGDARGARARARPAGVHRDEALDAAHRRRGRARARRPARTSSSASCSRRTTRASRSPATASSSRRRSPAAPSCASSRAGTTEPGFVDVLADARPRHRRARRLHRALAARRGSSTRAIRTRSSSSRRARLVAERAGARDWSFSYQSESPTGEPWLGPDILDHLTELHARGVGDVLVCPVGFVSDHLEIRWDIDVEAQERARELGNRRCDGSRCRTPTPSSWACSRGSSSGSCGTVARVTPRRDPRRARSRAASASTRSEARTLKELVVSRGRGRATDVWALAGRLVRRRAGEARRARRPQRLRQDDAAAARRGDHQADGGPRRGRRARRHRCSSSAPASTPTSPGARTST